MSHYKPDPDKNVNLTIDGIPVTVPEGTTILEAARKVNVKIPTLCDHPDLRRRAVCRLCVVECDGRGKLLAACANDVWEGVSVVTNNARIVGIRKTIIELMLANHPEDCLGCVKNTKCELQSLAERFGIRASPFSRGALKQDREIAGETVVRDMGKCVKCGRCVETCQEIQTVRAINTSHRSVNYEISTPYGQALVDGPCILCGQCAVVCPVGAIYAHDQTAEVWTALNKGERHMAAQLAPSTASAVCAEFDLPPKEITIGKIVTALKLIGFKTVFAADFFAAQSAREKADELLVRIKNKARLVQPGLPMISCCSQSCVKFVKEFYPDLADRLYTSKRPSQILTVMAREKYSGETGTGEPKIACVSITPCIAEKFETKQSEKDDSKNNDFALTADELARMIRIAGIELGNLVESPFDSFGDTFTGKFSEPDSLTVYGLANARVVLDSIRKGECDATLVKIMCCNVCPADDGSQAADCSNQPGI